MQYRIKRKEANTLGNSTQGTDLWNKEKGARAYKRISHGGKNRQEVSEDSKKARNTIKQHSSSGLGGRNSDA